MQLYTNPSDSYLPILFYNVKDTFLVSGGTAMNRREVGPVHVEFLVYWEIHIEEFVT